MATKTPAKATDTKIADRFERVKEGTSQLSGALTAGGKAYLDGVFALGRAFGDYRRDFVAEAGNHVKASFGAKSLREVTELQAAFAQQRIESSTAHTKEIADLTSGKGKEVLAPFTALLDQKTAA